MQSLKAAPLDLPEHPFYPDQRHPAANIIRHNFNSECTISFSTSFGRAEVLRTIPNELQDTWIKGLQHLANDHRYYEITQNHLGDQFGHHYLLLRDLGGSVRVIQPFFIVDQDLTAGLPNMVRKLVAQMGWGNPTVLNMRMLMVGCSAGEGHLARDARSSDSKWTATSLGESLQTVAKKMRASMVVFKDFPRTYRDSLDGLARYGYARAPSMPGSKLDLKFKTFDDDLVTKLSHKTRKNLRFKFRQALEKPPLSLEVRTDIVDEIDELLPLYQQVLRKSQYKFEALTRDYFVELGRKMGNRVLFFIWRQEGKAVAFSSCVGHEGVLRDQYIGMDYKVALDCHLYFVTWRDTLVWALKNGFHTYYSAPLNYEPKYHLRHDLAPLDLYVRATSRWLNPIMRLVLPYLEPTRYNSTLRKFANAADLW